MAAMDTIGVGFIGAGDISILHAKAVRKLPGAKLVGLWNRSQDRARQRATEFGCQNYATPEALVLQRRPLRLLALGLDLRAVPSSRLAISVGGFWELSSVGGFWELSSGDRPSCLVVDPA